MSARCFLFLQGPPGPFFADLAEGLRVAGHRCLRFNLCGGDRIDWRGDAIDFTGIDGQWPEAFGEAISRERVTDLVLFGDCRPLHRAAIERADQDGITVHVFEEGYIRPDWITLERGGVNGHSTLPRDPQVYLTLAAGLPAVPDCPPVPSSFRQRAREAVRHFLATWLMMPLYRGYRTHRPVSARTELAGWTRRMAARPLARWRSRRAIGQIDGKRFFLLPLQLDSDHQLRTHSPFGGMSEAITTILSSFAAHAPKDTVLLVKEHPLDNGLHNWRRTVLCEADRLAIGERVRFIAHGDLYSLVAACAGVVTVNSTTGTLALGSGIPVIVLGHAVYDIPGITHQHGLDRFWTEPSPPQIEIYEAFRRVLVARCLLRGGFSSIDGRRLLVPAAVARLGIGRQADSAPTTLDARVTA